MLHLINNTPFTSEISVCSDRNGIDILCIAVKATYDIKENIRIADEQRPIITEDVYWGEPGVSSLKYPMEITPEKPGTDVILIGEACAPENSRALDMSIGISAAGRKLAMKVSGDREWEKGLLFTRPSDPKPFERMPVIYERAYGGTQIINDAAGEILSETRNPVGKGFRGKRGDKELQEIGVPNIEDPEGLMKSPSDKSRPVGYGAIAPHWQPRAAFIGTYGDEWQERRALFLPEDFDPRHYQAAHPDLIFADRLKGGELFIITGMSPHGKKMFNLPADEPKVEVKITERFLPRKAWISTVLLEPTDERIGIVWLAAAAKGGRIKGAEATVNL
jgi:hypothetical protein